MNLAKVLATVGFPLAIVKTIKARTEPFGPPGLGVVRYVASWSIDDFAPNTYFATVRLLLWTGKPRATVALKMVEDSQMSGR